MALGYCRPDAVDGLFVDSLWRFAYWDATEGPGRVFPNGTVIAQASGPRIHAGRNNLVRAFMEHPKAPEWLLMVDTDMVFAPHQPYELLAVADPVERPIVGGLCFGGGRSGVVFPTIYKIERDATDGSATGSAIGIYHNYPANSLVRCDATGAAFLLIHRSVFERLSANYPEPHPWFAETVDAEKQVDYGEDMTFCIRAGALGMPIYVHTGVEIGHVKPMVIDAQNHRAYLDAKRQIGDEGVSALHVMKVRAGGPPPPAEERPVIDCSNLPTTETPTYVVIPVKDRHDLTQDLLDDLAEDRFERLWVFDNGSLVPASVALRLPERAKVVDKPRASLTKMWNTGLHMAEAHAKSQGHDRWQVAILNNDLRVPPYFLDLLARGLRVDDRLGIVYPDAFERGLPADQIVATTGIAPTGMAGFAFMVRGELGLRIDSQFEWFCGDDYIEALCRKKGYLVGCMGGIQIKHLEPNKSTMSDPARLQLAREDIARWQRLVASGAFQ